MPDIVTDKATLWFLDTIVWRIEQLAMGLIQSQEQRGQLTKIERRMVQAMAERAQKANVTLKTFNTFILKFPKIDASFEAVREVFNKAGSLLALDQVF